MTDRPSLQKILELEQIEDLMFRGRSRSGMPLRMFGGEVAGQALMAAGRTVPSDRRVHSLHAYFLRPGDPAMPLLYRVDAIRDGGHFTTRRVVAVQCGEVVFTLAASFHSHEEGVEHQVAHFDAATAEALPAANDLTGDSEAPASERQLLPQHMFPLDVRYPDSPPDVTLQGDERDEPRQRMWIRSTDALSDAPLMHACAATYVSDLFLLAAALPPHREVIGDATVQLTSLDHAVWFHAPFRADEWLLYEQEGYRATTGRALARGTLFDAAGVHVATVMQEGLLRLPGTAPRR